MPEASKSVPSVIASSVCWSLQCLVSALTQRGRWRTLFFFFFFFRFAFSVALWGGREGCCKQITLACARSASATLGLPRPVPGACSLPAHAAQALGCSAGNHPRPALGCLHFPGPSRSGSGTRVVLRGADSRLGLSFVPFPDPSSSGYEVFGACDCCDLSPPLRSVFWMYNRRTFSGGC